MKVRDKIVKIRLVSSIRLWGVLIKMTVVKNLFSILTIIASAVIVVSCVPKATENKAICGKNQAFDSVSRSCYSVEETRRVPVGTTSSVSTSEEKPVSVTLAYTDANLDQAMTCAISGISSASIEVVSPWITTGGIFTSGDLVYQSAFDLATSISSGAYVALANTAKLSMQTSYFKAKASFSTATIQSELANVQLQMNLLLGYATFYPANASIQNYYTLTQQRIIPFKATLIEMNNKCACSGGVCTTVVVPKLGQNGTGGFSYTITDRDGPSLAKAVSVTITPTALSAPHLSPAAESIYVPGLLESDTSLAPVIGYTFTIPDAGDISGTPASAMKYYFNGAKNGSNQGITAQGVVTNCMDLAGSTGLSDKLCTFIPNSYDAYQTTVAAKATATLGDLVFTAKSEGTAANSFTVQYFNLSIDNTTTDSYVTKIEKYGMVDPTSEAFIRVVGNAIKIFINPGITKSSDVATLIANHLQAKHLVTVSAGSAALPDATVLTPSSPVTFAGGVDAFDIIPFYVSNGSASSVNAANIVVTMAPNNDYPMVPRTYIPFYSRIPEEYLESASHAIILGYKDVDDNAGFTVTAKVDTSTPTCPVVSNAYYTALITDATNFSVPVAGAESCVAGVCTTPMTVQALGDYSGTACLYYQVTDVHGLASNVQGVTIHVTNINDAPLLSRTDTLPTTVNPLLPKTINEDLAIPSISFTDIYINSGGGVFEAAQTFTVTATSSTAGLVPNTACTGYTPVTASPIGVTIPPTSTSKFFDTVNLRCYIATGTLTANDWKLFPSLTVFPAETSYNSFGSGAPSGTPGSAGLYYLDTLNNIAYKSTASAWAVDTGLLHYQIAYVPMTYQSGSTNINVTVQDSGGVANGGVDTTSNIFALTVTSVDNPPVFLSTITSVETNEGGAVQSNAFQVDEDTGSTADENAQGITITDIISDNISVLPASAITVFYDLNDNGVQDALEQRCAVTNAACIAAASLAGVAVPTRLEVAAADDVKLHKFYLKLDPVDGVSGNANITLKISDGTTEVATQFSFIVHPVAALHGGWTNISSVGLKTDKNRTPTSVADVKCNYNKLVDTNKCKSGATAVDCIGSTSPNSTILPDSANVVYWDSSANRCYRSKNTGSAPTVFDWVDMNTSCPITKIVGTCSDNSCISTITPIGATVPSFVGQYLYNATSNTCYVSTGTTNTDWATYIPAKVTLAWKPFVMVGSGADSAVQIAGWNVYRREVNADYNFKGGHLKDAASTAIFSVANASTRTFTDTTAVAGKVYYYVVRPVDTIRNFPTYTPEKYSEVRVVAAPENYSFVHRWIVNQEICNGMNITNTTTPHHIDQTQNFRCEYSGPGSVNISGTDYYDYGKDLLVDSQESGCAYAAAPACTANGCIDIGNPTTLGYSASTNDLYYDRNSGACYINTSGGSGVSWSIFEAGAMSASIVDKTKSALNAPLTNISKSKAVAICSARTKPTLSYTSIGVTTTFTPAGASRLPYKKDYMAYSSQRLDLADTEIAAMEQGFSLNIQSACNGSAASGLESAYTDSAIPSTSFIYSLPGTFSSGIRSLYTGSIPWGSNMGTEACISRFGIQDLYGNVAEWVDDGMTCDPDPYSTKVCTANASGSFTANDFGASFPYAFDNVVGPFAEGGDGVVNGSATTTSAPFLNSEIATINVISTAGFPATGTILIENEDIAYTSITGTTFAGLTRGVNGTTAVGHAGGVTITVYSDDSWLTNWAFADALFGAGKFNYPLGLPLNNNINQATFSGYLDWVLSIGPSNGITTNKLHGDGIIVNSYAGAAKSFAVGGSYLSGNRSGRFSSELIPDGTANRPDVGLRCIVPISSSDYPVDVNYNYPN
jgi:hypothetical protein